MTLTDTLAQRAEVARAIDTFLAHANANCPEGYLYSAQPSGKKYRIVMAIDGSDRSVHAFVDGDTGDLLKADGWKVPAKGVRYNLLSEMDVVLANFTWSGGYLYKDWKRRPVCYDCGKPATAKVNIYKRDDTDPATWWEDVCGACAEYHVAHGAEQA